MSDSNTDTTRPAVAVVSHHDRNGATRNGRPRDVELDVNPTLATEGPPGLVVGEQVIDDCLFRMLALHEIAEAMAMSVHTDGSEYQVLGNKREQMAQYGNAITPPATELLVGRLLEVIE